MTDKIRIAFGVIAPPLSEQLKEYGLSKQILDRHEKVRDAINRLSFSDILPESQINKCFQKLIKQIAKDIQQGQKP